MHQFPKLFHAGPIPATGTMKRTTRSFRSSVVAREALSLTPMHELESLVDEHGVTGTANRLLGPHVVSTSAEDYSDAHYKVRKILGKYIGNRKKANA